VRIDDPEVGSNTDPQLAGSPTSVLTGIQVVPGSALSGFPEHERRAQLLVRLKAMLIEGSGKPVLSGEPPAAAHISYELLTDAQAAASDLLKDHRDEVHWVTPTARADQREAAAYVVADVVRGQLLEHEQAGSFGQRIINTLGPKSAVSKALAADKNKGYKDVARARKQGESAAEEAKAAVDKRRLELLRAPLPLELTAPPLLQQRKREREPERDCRAEYTERHWSVGAPSSA